MNAVRFRQELRDRVLVNWYSSPAIRPSRLKTAGSQSYGGYPGSNKKQEYNLAVILLETRRMGVTDMW